MIYVQLKHPDEVVFHYHSTSEDDPCRNIPLPTGEKIAEIILALTSEEYQIFYNDFNGLFDVVSSTEYKEAMQTESKLMEVLNDDSNS